jgi:hypothetical protein
MPSGIAIGRIFSARNNRAFFGPAQPEKCSGIFVICQKVRFGSDPNKHKVHVKLNTVINGGPIWMDLI